MSKKTRLYAFPVLLMASFSCAGAKVNLGEVGQLHFSISITNTTCGLEKKGLEVDMGKIPLPSPVSVGGILSEKDFTIEMKECDGISKVKVMMDSLPDSDDNSLFALDNGGATGVALKIVTDKGTQQKPKASGGTPVEWKLAEDGTGKLNYRASYVIVNSKVTGGAANALVNFSVEYD